MSVADVLADPNRKDVVVAVLGASAALGGFVLVFMGTLLSAYRSYAADATKGVKERHRRVVWPVLGVFCLCVIGIAVAFVWLSAPGGTCLYYAVLTIFTAELASIVGVAVFTVARVAR